MELRQIFAVVVRWLWLIILSTGVAAGSTYYTTGLQPSTYRTKTTLMIGRAIESAVPDSGAFYMGNQLALTYAQLVKREPVLRGAVESLNLGMDWESLGGRVSVNLVPQTQLMEISVVDTNPYRAKALADAIAQQLILLTPEGRNAKSSDQAFAQKQVDDLKAKIDDGKKQIEQLTKERDAAISARRIQDLEAEIRTLDGKVSEWQSTYSQFLIYLKGGDVNVISVVEEATVPIYPIGPDLRSNVMLAAAIGAALAIGGAFLIEYLDDTIKSQEEVEKRLGLATLGVVGRISNNGMHPETVALHDPHSPFAEAYRMLRTSLRFSLPLSNRGRVFMVTSVGPGEGKTTTASNLAAVMAQAGQHVILVDSDLRRGSLDTVWGCTNEIGLTSLLVGDLEGVKAALQPTAIENLRLLASGPLAPNAPELLASPRMVEVLQELVEEADVTILDTAPLMPVADTSILASLVTGTLLVIEIGRTRLDACLAATETIRKAGGNVLGVVLNRQSRRQGRYGYYSYYGYGSQGDGHKHKKKLGWFFKRRTHQDSSSSS